MSTLNATTAFLLSFKISNCFACRIVLYLAPSIVLSTSTNIPVLACRTDSAIECLKSLLLPISGGYQTLRSIYQHVCGNGSSVTSRSLYECVAMQKDECGPKCKSPRGYISTPWTTCSKVFAYRSYT